MNFLNGWYGMVNTVKSVTAVLVIAGGLAGIFAIVFFSIFKIRKINANLAIMASTILSCFFMVPVISAFNNLVDLSVKGAIIKEGKAEIKAKVKALEKEKLENQITIAKQSIQIEALNDDIKLLENAQLSVQSFEKILELALLQTDIQQTLVRKESLSELSGGWDSEPIIITMKRLW